MEKIDLSHWDTVEFDFTFDQVASLSCGWDPYLSAYQAVPPLIAAKRDFMKDKIREAYKSVISWCNHQHRDCYTNNRLDEHGYPILPFLPSSPPWPFEVTPYITPDVDGLWADAGANLDFPLREALTNIGAVEYQPIERAAVVIFLQSLGWVTGYDFSRGTGHIQSDSEQGQGQSSEMPQISNEQKNRGAAESNSLHGRSREHYLKVIAGFLTMQNISSNESTAQVLRQLEIEGKQLDINRATLTQTLRAANAFRK